MDITHIIQAIQFNLVLITRHAREEAENDSLTLDEILFSVSSGEIIAVYSDDKPFPSCLIYGSSPSGNPIHSVWAYNAVKQLAILITVYRPDPNLWIDWRHRRKP